MIEIMLQKLYAGWGMTDQTDFTRLGPQEYPVLADLYTLIEKEYKEFDEKKRQLYTAEMLQSILLGLNSMCVGSESKFFNGHTNITDSSFVTFGVKGLLQASRSLKDSLLFNTLSFMSNELLTEGNTVASLDEFYLFLSNLTAVEYVRNFEKRVRKRIRQLSSPARTWRISIWKVSVSIQSLCFPSLPISFYSMPEALMPSFIRILCNWRTVNIT